MTIHFFVNFEVFKSLYLSKNLPDKYQTWGFFWISVCSFRVCGSIVANPIIYRLVPSPSRFENRQCKSKVNGDCCIFKFLQCSVEGKYLTHFQSETSVFDFSVVVCTGPEELTLTKGSANVSPLYICKIKNISALGASKLWKSVYKESETILKKMENTFGEPEILLSGRLR